MCSDPDPLLLLRLYPQLVPHKFTPLLPTSAYGEQLPELEQQQQPAAAAAGSSGEPADQQQQQQQPDPAAAAAAVSVVVPYLLSHRTRLLGSLEGAAAGAAADSNGSNGSSDTGSSSGKPKTLRELRLLATVIDTAILRAMLLQPDSGALLRLVQQVNYVDLEDGEAVLTAGGRYAELAALYQYHRRHEKGLRLLQQLSQRPEGLAMAPTGAAADLRGLPGVWAAVR